MNTQESNQNTSQGANQKRYFTDEEIEDVLSNFHAENKTKSTAKEHEDSQEKQQTYQPMDEKSADKDSLKDVENPQQKRDLGKNFSKDEANLSVQLMQRLIELQATKKILTEDQKKKILMNPGIKDEHKAILLLMLNDPNPKKTLRSFYKTKEGEMMKQMMQGKVRGKNPLTGVASFVKETSARLQFD